MDIDFEFYDLNEDEVEEAMGSLYSILFLKELVEIFPENYKALRDGVYKCIPIGRDMEWEGQCGIEFSEVTEFMFDTMFGLEGYKIETIAMDEDFDFFEELYYNFRVPLEYRIYDENDFDNICQCYKTLRLQSDIVKKAVRVASKDKTVFDELLKKAKHCIPNTGDLEEFVSFDFKDEAIEFLLSTWSIYEIELYGRELLNLYLYCKEVIGNE